MTRGLLFSLVLLVFVPRANACINDSLTLSQEKRRQPKLADAIFKEPEPVNVQELNNRIAMLEANPKQDDPAWWNDLAGGYLRLGRAAEAAQLLEPITNRFANDYGVHANLGTAYHLLGWYKEAEAEIRRDLEINPEGHGGLEKYHLALLQYLSRDADYQLCHVYVEEFTQGFLLGRGNTVARGTGYGHALTENELKTALADIKKQMAEPTSVQASGDLSLLMAKVADSQPPPMYMTNFDWDISRDPKLEEGVAYMAMLNRKEPACFVMVGVVANSRRNRNIAKAAFQRAIELGSPQRVILEKQIVTLNGILSKGWWNSNSWIPSFAVLVLGAAYIAVRVWMDARKKAAAKFDIATST